ncbi:uncharacterized protein [Amphiura filiformis]|uniref:uncharacterized protein n=1 Tax=Amphiura filiformis TaxID=82378 RepID=UPI003B20F016
MSVAHKASKRPWGTITKPSHMHLGHKKVTSYEIEQTVSRLYYVPKARDVNPNRPNPKMSASDVSDMIERLTLGASEKSSDAKRVAEEGPLKDMGILNSFAWKGYN